MIKLFNERLGLRLRLLMLAKIHERDEMLHDATVLISNRADEESCPELTSILAAVVNFWIALGAALKRGSHLCHRLRIGSLRHQEVEALPEHLVPVVSG